jgi:hypothetical protein
MRQAFCYENGLHSQGFSGADSDIGFFCAICDALSSSHKHRRLRMGIFRFEAVHLGVDHVHGTPASTGASFDNPGEALAGQSHIRGRSSGPPLRWTLGEYHPFD